MPDDSDIDLGWFTLCFDVKDMGKALEFYRQLRFSIETGGIEEGGCQVTNGNVRLTFFSNGFIQKEFGVSHLFNFRGGDVRTNFENLKKLGISFTQDLKIHEDGSIDAKFEDLDGNVIYLDTHPSEVQD